MKKQRQHYELDYKRRIVQEYLAGVVPAQELARREGIARVQAFGCECTPVRSPHPDRTWKLTIEQWHEVIDDPTLAAAIIEKVFFPGDLRGGPCRREL